MGNKIKSSILSKPYVIVFWMIINITLMLMMLPDDFMDLNNWIELALWSSSIV